MDTRIYDETNLTPTELTKILPTRPSTGSVWRWMHRGIQGVRLEHWYVGGQIMTSQEAADRFFENVARAKEAKRRKHKPQVTATPAVRRAEADLEKAGF